MSTDAATSPPPGLSAAEAARRLATDGPNELPQARDRGLAGVVVDELREPTLLMLVAAVLLYMALGDLGESLVLVACVAVVLGIAVFQRHRAEQALKALRDLAAPPALAIRDGAPVRVPGRDVVRGDLIVLTEGDRVPADATVIAANDLAVDESLLTGESVPVRKAASAGAAAAPRPGGDESPFVFAGSMVVRGRGHAVVTATGARSEIGRIGTALATIHVEPTPLQRQTARIVKWLGLFALASCAALALVYGLARGSWIDGALAGIALAMSAMPEEFPVILAVFLALGAWRLSRAQVLVRRMAAIEALGAVTVLCLDKTGTLTQNRMAIRSIGADGRTHVVSDGGAALPPWTHAPLAVGILASEIDAYDPMEKAFHALGARVLGGTGLLHPDWTLVHDYPLAPGFPAMVHVWRPGAAGPHVVAAKGAPEAIAALCRLDEATTRALLDQVTALAADGQRVLALARATWPDAAWPESPAGFAFEPVGLVGLSDPLRPAAPAAVAALRRAGVRVVMVTGDFPVTAAVIGRAAGLDDRGDTVTGAELERLTDDTLAARLFAAAIFARVAPDQKLRLVEAYKRAGEVVAMTGDGVNDAPALRAAHVGVAMGARGTDVAREAAAIVLTDDDIESIARAVRLGRRTFDNIKRAMAYVLSVHVPVVGLAVVPVLLGWPLVLLPVHVAFLEFVIDTTCSVAFEAEPEAPDLMTRPPRDPHRPPLDRSALLWSLAVGASVLVAAVLAYLAGTLPGTGEDHARAVAFATLTVGNLSLILANRSWTRGLRASLAQRNVVLWSVIAVAAAALALALAVPALRELFRFAPLGPRDVALCLLAGTASVAVPELARAAFRRRR